MKLLKKIKAERRMISTLAGMHVFGNPSKKLKIVGVTGTNGKTTVTTLLYKVATELGYKSGLIGTVENIIGTERREALRTTPSPIDLNKLLKDMADQGCEYVFMEVSSHALDQNRVAGINFVGGVFTNLTLDHLDYHKSFENYFGAKKKFFKMLPHSAFALSNADDKEGERMLAGIKAHKYFYGFDHVVDFSGKILGMDFGGLNLVFNNQQIYSKMLGKFNAYNLLSVYGASKLLGLDMERVKKVIENIEPPKGRFEHFTSNGVLAIVDYAHTPDALENVLQTAKNLIAEKGKGRLISIFGCGGDRDASKRSIMGKIGAELSEIAIFTTDNSRSEDPEKIISQMMVSLSEELKRKVKIITNRKEAIAEAVKMANEGDIILCAGKGHETYQEIKGVKTHFDDMEELRNFLK